MINVLEKRFSKTTLLLLVMMMLFASCKDDSVKPEIEVSSLSYRGHENDADSRRLVYAYPAIAGTRIDDCQTCHRDGEVTNDQGKTSELNPCSYCHLIPYPDASITSGAPVSYENTLNPFGLDYKKAGRDGTALKNIGKLDSDGDSYTNRAELEDLRYTGDPESKPGQLTVPIRTFTWNEMINLPSHSQFLLMNSHKQEFDNYAAYEGVKIKDLLEALGADLSGATSVTMIAPDGYAKDISLDDINNPFPPGLYFANLDPGSFSDPGQGFVTYPPEDQMPGGLVDGGEIPGEHWLIVAYQRNGRELDQGYLDPALGKLNGEGPYRLVVPQSNPGAPDRGSRYSPSGYDDGYDYDEDKDYNAGLCVRALVAIRINPMPQGYEEFDWKNGGWALVEQKKLIVYGAGVTGN